MKNEVTLKWWEKFIATILVIPIFLVSQILRMINWISEPWFVTKTKEITHQPFLRLIEYPLVILYGLRYVPMLLGGVLWDCVKHGPRKAVDGTWKDLIQ